MPSWPTRISLSSLGPFPRKNFGGVRGDDQTYLNDNYVNLICWQLAGANLMVPKAMVVFTTVNGADPTIVEHHETWNPRDDQAAPTAIRVSEGLWRFTYPATVKDMDDNDVSPGLKWVEQPSLQGTTADAVLRGRCTAENVVEVTLYQAGVVQDLPGSTILVMVR